MTIHSYKELIVWQKAMDLVVSIYRLTGGFPKDELYSLTNQMRRAAVSIPSNIAEGRCRSTRKDFLQFLRIANGSGSELETQLEIAKRLSFGDKSEYNKIEQQLSEVMRMLNSMITKLNPTLSR